ncbi:MAG: ABC transporter permease [Lachnospiraceae bacterium]|nr:ABC transporter permease [Lachnospiraceae bacterium]
MNKLACIRFFKDMITSREMLIKLAKNDFKKRYAGSYLGIIWAFIQPVVTIVLYWFVFSLGLRSRPMNGYPYVLWLTAGLIPWFLFSDSINGGVNSLLEYSFLVKKVVFNISILPALKILSALFIDVFFYVFMMIMFMCMGYMPTIYAFQLIYYIICTVCVTLAVSYLTSAITVFVRDIAHFIAVGLQILMWITPIMWPVTMLAESHPTLLIILKLNPVFYIVEGVRNSMFGTGWFWQDWQWTLYFWVFTIVVFIFGAHVFDKLKPHFADVL